jgi:NAD(P) transhydrogenase subunit beta
MEIQALVNVLYLISIIGLIIGLRRLSSPATARNGNVVAALSMGLAIVTTLFMPIEAAHNNYLLIVLALALGSIIGLTVSKRVKMTAMPELVSLFNGFGGACAMAISMVELYKYQDVFDGTVTAGVALSDHFTTYMALFIGAVAFSGSMIAYAKLAGIMQDNKFRFSTILNIILVIVILALIVFRIISPDASFTIPLVIMGVALIYGISFVHPIGGADMPVVISLLNAFSGVAAALAGIVYDNQIMLIGGIIVGSAGTILTILMCNAMNRSLFNVIIGGFGLDVASSADRGEQVVKEATTNDVAVMLRYSDKVTFIPGYGMAVAQAQKVVHELDTILTDFGVDVKYAIHPVAGRMPGHMNVLLAEANVPYPSLMDLDDANDSFPDTDVSIVVGANDVVNPSALDDPSSSIYGMPILEITKGKNVIVMKRSMRPGYAGIENPLFFHEKTQMYFGDAKESIQKLIQEVKEMD